MWINHAIHSSTDIVGSIQMYKFLFNYHLICFFHIYFFGLFCWVLICLEGRVFLLLGLLLSSQLSECLFNSNQ